MSDGTQETAEVEGRLFLATRPAGGDEFHTLAIAGYESFDATGRTIESEQFDLGDFAKTGPGADIPVVDHDHDH